MSLAELLGVRPGLTAVIGGGGKTTLLYTLAEELREHGSVIVTTSTKIRRPRHLVTADPESPEALQAALAAASPLCVGSPWPEDKLAAPTLPFGTLCEAADWVLAEADGSKGLPAKAHAPHEPVIPAEAGTVILVLGADAFGRPISEVCHRPELYAALAETTPETILSPELAARVLRKEGYGNIIYVNKCEAEADWQNARALAALLDKPVVAGSLHVGICRAHRKAFPLRGRCPRRGRIRWRNDKQYCRTNASRPEDHLIRHRASVRRPMPPISCRIPFPQLSCVNGEKNSLSTGQLCPQGEGFEEVTELDKSEFVQLTP